MPREVVELLRAVADAGLPLAWDGEEIAFACFAGLLHGAPPCRSAGTT